MPTTFVRMQSTLCEAQAMEKLMLELDAHLLMVRPEWFVVRSGSRRRAPRLPASGARAAPLARGPPPAGLSPQRLFGAGRRPVPFSKPFCCSLLRTFASTQSGDVRRSAPVSQSLALGYDCFVYDYASRNRKRGVPRALWCGAHRRARHSRTFRQ